MPNHIYSRLVMSGDQQQIEECVEAAKTLDKEGKEYIDFSSIYPCPEELTRVRTGIGANIVSQAEYDKQFTEPKSVVFENTYAITQEMANDYKRRFGVDNWYDWCNKHWGTKWGTYQVEEVRSNEYTFQTAWSPANGLWVRISEIYPGVLFATEVADEGGGFIGKISYQSGEILENESYAWKSDEAAEIRQNVGMDWDDEDEEDEGDE